MLGSHYLRDGSEGGISPEFAVPELSFARWAAALGDVSGGVAADRRGGVAGNKEVVARAIGAKTLARVPGIAPEIPESEIET